MIRLMSDCLLRISEVVAVNVEDIGKVLTVRSSKTDQEGEGTALYVGAPTHKAIRKYRKAAGIEEGALFRRVRWQKHITPDRLSVNGARNAIKRWAAEAGVEGFISGHSLRVGSAVSLARAGARWWICRRRADGMTRKCRRVMRRQTSLVAQQERGRISPDFVARWLAWAVMSSVYWFATPRVNIYRQR